MIGDLDNDGRIKTPISDGRTHKSLANKQANQQRSGEKLPSVTPDVDPTPGGEHLDSELAQMKKRYLTLREQLNQDDIKRIIASRDCPKARTFGEMVPLAFTVNKKKIQTENTNLCHLPYDRWRVIKDDGTEELPHDVYGNDEEGRRMYARDVLECNMRNLVRTKIMEKMGYNEDNINEPLYYKFKKKKGGASDAGSMRGSVRGSVKGSVRGSVRGSVKNEGTAEKQKDKVDYQKEIERVGAEFKEQENEED